MARIIPYTQAELITKGWDIQQTGDVVDVSKEFADNELYEDSFTGADSMELAITFCSMIEYGYNVPEPIEYYFPKEKILTWITPSQLGQFEKINPNCFEDAYKSALGFLYGEFAYNYDLDEALRIGNDGSPYYHTLSWMLEVFTAHNICAPAMQLSEPLRNNFAMAMKKVEGLKNHENTLFNAPRPDKVTQPNARPSLTFIPDKNQG